MTTKNNTLKSGTPTKRSTLAGISADRKQAEQREKAKATRDGAKVRQKYKYKKKPK